MEHCENSIPSLSGAPGTWQGCASAAEVPGDPRVSSNGGDQDLWGFALSLHLPGSLLCLALVSEHFVEAAMTQTVPAVLRQRGSLRGEVSACPSQVLALGTGTGCRAGLPCSENQAQQNHL